MPRLKLKRFRAAQPGPDTLARYLVAYAGRDLYQRPQTLAPIAAEAYFGAAAPIVLDLGCGRGEYLIEQAAARPDEYFVGIDWHLKSLWDAVNRAEQAQLNNIRFVKADLRLALPLVPAEVVSEVTLLFPPPHVERRRQKTDLLTEDALREFQRMLLPGAALHFVTDHDEYFARKRALIEASGWCEVVAVEQQSEGGRTRFQRFWEARAIASKRLECRKMRD